MVSYFVRKKRGCLASVSTAALVLASSCGAALAQEESETVKDLLIVTATKRASSIQDVPMAISAFGSEAIERNGFNSIKDYGVRVPNLTFNAGGESRNDNQLAIAIRGIVGNGTTGFYIDESPLLESVNPRVIELERIEVLRGPQGTLYGARSMGGTVRLITKQPEINEFGGGLRASTSHTKDGGWNHQLDGSVNLPLIEDVFAVRMLGYVQTDAGFIDRAPLPDSPVQFDVNENINSSRVYGGQITGRLSLANGDLIVTPRFAFEDSERDGRTQADTVAGNRVNARLFDIEESNGSDWQLGTLTVEHNSPIGQFISATSYFTRSSIDKEDNSEVLNLFFPPVDEPVPAFFEATDDDEVFSQELRFVSDFDGPLQVTAGLFYQFSEADLEFLPTGMEGVADVLFTLDLVTKVKEKAAFAEMTYDVTDRLRLIAGARLFDNEVDFISSAGGLFGDPTVFEGIQEESDVNPKFGLQFDIDDDRMLYATAAKGFRIGGVNSFNTTGCAAGIADLGFTVEELLGFESDKLWSYEGGIRSTWLDRRLMVNAAVFYIDWSDLQQRLGLGDCGFFADANVGSAENIGFELELDFDLTDSLNVFVNTGYTHAEIVDNAGFADAVAVGQPVQNVPEWTVSAGFDYDFLVGAFPMFLHGDIAHVSESFNGRNSGAMLRRRPPFTILNLRAGVDLDGAEIAVFASNLTDEAANFADVPPVGIEFPDRPRIFINQPRTVGVEFRARF